MADYAALIHPTAGCGGFIARHPAIAAVFGNAFAADECELSLKVTVIEITPSLAPGMIV